ncbi:MAG: hypothetical protein ACJ71Y_03895 [Blastococcus sp.]|jgi:hypothetical protein
MTGPRQIVVDALAPLGYKIVQGRLPQNIAAPTLLVSTASFVPGPIIFNLAWTLQVVVLSPLLGEKAEDDLEQVVRQVAAALVAAQPLLLVNGDRATVADDAYNAFTLTVEVTTSIEETP